MRFALTKALKQSSRRGFTLIEMMLVVAIIMVGVSLAFWTTVRQQEKAKVSDAARTVIHNLELARSLSKGIPSHRLRGQAGCNLDFSNCGLGGVPQDCRPWIRINTNSGAPANIIRIPERIVWNGTMMQTACENFNVANPHNESAGIQARVIAPALAASFSIAFTPNGRLIYDANNDGNLDPLPANGIYFRVERTVGGTARLAESYGIRVLPSGVICRSDITAPANPSQLCNMDPEAG
ncbi:MAG: type II secretion system protein [Deltaproteobacteria bacterium]|nr:type II secretion system protein [Deltaproteobacteria bacterium]